MNNSAPKRFPSKRGFSLRMRFVAFLSVFVLFALLAAGCSAAPVAGTSKRDAAPTPIPPPSGLNDAGEKLSLELVENEGVKYITDHEGFVVYGLEDETALALLCVDECRDDFTPLAPRDKAVADGLDIELFTSFTRPDGDVQVLYNEIPLYRWSGDTKVGVAGGSGVAGVWFALDADANPLK